MTDVTIPADVAKDMAAFFRQDNEGPDHNGFQRWADLLDPKPLTLREKVAETLLVIRTPDAQADAVLAVVADWLAAQPQFDGYPPADEPPVALGATTQRDHDVRLLRGESGG